MTSTPVAKQQKVACSVCEGSNLTQILDLPEFPITGIYLEQPATEEYRGIDQGFMLCADCGHGQLLYSVDPNYIYGPTYWHRSSASPIATSGNDFFADFINRFVGDQTFNLIVEIGCNDLYLLRKMAHKGRRLYGIDPIWRGRESQETGDIKVLGRFVEEVDFSNDLGGSPDLILSAHTFEHVDDPKRQLERLIQNAADDALFFIEVPGFDSLLTNSRFDQIFHQHIQYFSLPSFRRMIADIGGEYLTHTFNYSYWGGTMMVGFKKASSAKEARQPNGLVPPTPQFVQERYQIFRERFDGLAQTIGTLVDSPIYGYGAAQMVPTMAYHLGSDLSFLICILDDNPDRADLRYPGLSVWTRQPDRGLDLTKASVLITALDSLRPILQRLISMQARHILVPLNML